MIPPSLVEYMKNNLKTMAILLFMKTKQEEKIASEWFYDNG
jgi:hypothetical protein